MSLIFRISSPGNPDIDVHPYSGKDQKITWEREDDRKYDFKKELKEITLVKDDFKYFHAFELSDDRCDLQTLSVISDCGFNDTFVLFEGTFTMSSGDWDLDRCIVTFEIKSIDPYECIEENDDDHNILEFVLPRTVNFGFTFGYEAFMCGGSCGECNQTTIENGLWTFLDSFELPGATRSVYIREYLLTSCDYSASSFWTLNQACTGGQKKYIKKYVSSGATVSTYNCDVYVNDPPITQIDNGRDLLRVLQTLLDRACFGSGLTIVSDFFQWNPENVSTINYVTGELNKLRNLIIFQKSDVKRPSVSGNATKGEINFDDLLEQVLNLFNCGYKIIGNTFRIEHIIWFESDLGINLLAIDQKKKLLNATKKYSYDSSKLPKYEKFEMMESGSADFVGVDIVYDSNCVNNSPENKSTTTVDKITTDVMYCLENPASDSDVSDDGFVIIACDQNYNIYYEDGILESSTSINNILSWAHLHRDYWKHGRVLPIGIMNNAETEFLSVVPTIKQKQFSVVMDCQYLKVFDPLDKIKGSLGWGFVQTAELKLSQCAMSLQLNLDKITNETYETIYGDFDGDHDEDFD